MAGAGGFPGQNRTLCHITPRPGITPLGPARRVRQMREEVAQLMPRDLLRSTGAMAKPQTQGSAPVPTGRGAAQTPLPLFPCWEERVAGEAVLPVGRVRGAYGGVKTPPFRLTMDTQICLTKH